MGEIVKRSLDIDLDIWNSAKHTCIDDEENLSDYISKLIVDDLKRRKKWVTLKLKNVWNALEE